MVASCRPGDRPYLPPHALDDHSHPLRALGARARQRRPARHLGPHPPGLRADQPDPRGDASGTDRLSSPLKLLSLPTDSEGFVRRECPSCHREFKSRPFPSDGLALNRYLSRASLHENREELDHAIAGRACLYCGRRAPPEAFLTDDQRKSLDRIADASEADLRHEQLHFVARTLSQNPRPTFVPVAPRKVCLSMPPEPDDLQPVPLMCCQEDAKGDRRWLDIVYCPRCGARQATRPRMSLTVEFVRE
jgi:hypothetical protein